MSRRVTLVGATAIATGITTGLSQIDDPRWRAGLSLAALLVLFMAGWLAPQPQKGGGE